MGTLQREGGRSGLGLGLGQVPNHGNGGLRGPAPPYENGHVTHLDLAHGCPAAGACPSSHGHLSGGGQAGSLVQLPPSLVNDSTRPEAPPGSCLTSSLSAAALNQSSCAVPMSGHPALGVGGGFTLPHPLQHSLSADSGSGWGASDRERDRERERERERDRSDRERGGSRGAGGMPPPPHYHHQEQCPHFSGDFKFKEAPS